MGTSWANQRRSMDVLASLSAAADPISLTGSSNGASGQDDSGADHGRLAAGSSDAQGSSITAAARDQDHPAVTDEASMLEAEKAAVATLALVAAGPGRKRAERSRNDFLLQRAMGSDEVSAAEATAVAALAQNGRDSPRKRARQLDFGGKSSAGTDAVFAQAYPIKNQPHDDGDDEQPLSPSSAAGTLLGLIGAAAQWYGDTGGPSTPNKRKACNCKNSKCLKLYCECFASGSYCNVSCNCQSCQNNEHFQSQRKSAIDATLERNPMAFRPKIAASTLYVEQSPSAQGRHTKGCHCKKSGCLKKYCECFQAGVLCSAQCKCHECKNTEESMERKALLTSSGWHVATPHANSSKDRLGSTPSPVVSKHPRHLHSPCSLAARRSSFGQDEGYHPILDPDEEMLLPRMGGGGEGSGAAIALQVQETMMNLRLAHKSSAAGCHVASSVLGLPQEREVKLAERTTVRNCLSDPMLFNLCRVLLLSAKKVADSGSELPAGAALAAASDAQERKARKLVEAAGKASEVSDATANAASASGVNGKHAGSEEGKQAGSAHAADSDVPLEQRMQGAVLLELRHYLGQMQAIIDAGPSGQ